MKHFAAFFGLWELALVAAFLVACYGLYRLVLWFIGRR